MKKIAIPTNGNAVDDHFGHCQYYTIFSLSDENKIENKEIMPSPAGCGCKSDIAYILADMGVKTMLAGNMGEGAFNKLSSAGMEVYRGYSGNVEEVLGAYLGGDKGDERLCSNHQHHHGGGDHSCHN